MFAQSPSTTFLQSQLQTQRKANPNSNAAIANSQSRTVFLDRFHSQKPCESLQEVNSGLGVRITVSFESDGDAESGVLGRDESPESGLPAEGGVWIAVTSDSGEDVEVGACTPLPNESPESEERVGDGV
jgi:hypothetical protein